MKKWTLSLLFFFSTTAYCMEYDNYPQLHRVAGHSSLIILQALVTKTYELRTIIQGILSSTEIEELDSTQPLRITFMILSDKLRLYTQG